METPICDFVKEYVNDDKLRLHMPGHKGHTYLGFESLDITEIPGADVLYDSNGIIAKSEENASKLFGTAKTVYSTEGSSLAIRAMLYLTKIYGQTKAVSSDTFDEVTVLAGRNAHKTFVTAAALLDIDVNWIMPDAVIDPQNETAHSLISCNITSEILDFELQKFKADKGYSPVAVYVTSPDYLGNILDIKGLAEVCRKFDVLLLVDNAHGAYLNFLPESRHPIALGASMCCDSAHKTLPVLTGGAYLHISEVLPPLFEAQANQAMSLFASTSPSYLILQSLDFTNKYLADGYKARLADFTEKIKCIKENLAQCGFKIMGNEPLKLTIESKSYGYTGEALAKYLAERNIICEFYDPDCVVLMLTPEICIDDLDYIEKTLATLQKKSPIHTAPPRLPTPHCALPPRKAVLAPSENVPLSDACGRILASVSVSCPPAIPILMCGEVIDETAIECFEYYGIRDVKIVL